MQANISRSVTLYLDLVSLNLFENYATGCQICLCCCCKTAPTTVPDAFDLTCTGNSGSYNLKTGANVKASFSALKAACYSAPNLKDFFQLSAMLTPRRLTARHVSQELDFFFDWSSYLFVNPACYSIIDAKVI